jgi:hypothetical protein
MERYTWDTQRQSLSMDLFDHWLSGIMTLWPVGHHLTTYSVSQRRQSVAIPTVRDRV